VKLRVVPQLSRSRKDKVLLVNLCLTKRARVVEVSVLLFAHKIDWAFLVLIGGTPLSWRPVAALGDVGHGSSKLNLNLGGMGVLEERLRDILIEEIDLFDSFRLEEGLNDGPDHGDRGSDPHVVGCKQARSVGIGEEAKGLLHAFDH
jgi:hypothetical protein